MASLRRAFFDTSVLVAGMVDLGASSIAPLAVLDAVAEGSIARPLTAWHCCLEFFSVTTRLPEEYRLEPDTSLRFLREEILARFEVCDLPPDAREELLRSAAGEGLVGGRIYDSHIAEVARRHRSTLVVTENRRHFSSLLSHGIRVLLSRELLAELTPG